MYTFNVNGQRVTTEKKQSLLRFLRDELHLTSVKDGCSQGACGLRKNSLIVQHM